jgi:competence ComEA-like helix-hairpin-helix protein
MIDKNKSLNQSRPQTKDKQLFVLFFVFTALLCFNLRGFFPEQSITEIKNEDGQIVFFNQRGTDSHDRGENTLSPRLSFFLNQPMDINQATAPDLELISGIGPRTAERIIAYRNEFGSFMDSRELENIHGIGPKTSRKLSKHVSFR